MSLEIIKSNLATLYKAFMIARTYKTAVKNKKEKGRVSLVNSKINEMDLKFEDKERAEIEAIKCKYQQKKMFRSNNGSAYQQRSNGGNGSNSGNSNNSSNCNNRNGSRHPEPHANKMQHLERLATISKRKITSRVTITKGNVTMHQWLKCKN